MPCYTPIPAYRAPGGGVAFSPKVGYVDRPLNLSCGQCIGCRLARSQAWAARCVHEAQLHEANCFITLTYREPAPASLDRSAFPEFMRRLRRAHPGLRLKYFHCGEYGEASARPHYHAIIFGYDFPDKKHWRTGAQGHAQYASSEAEGLWKHGFVSIGAVSFETAAYTARYVCKKITGPLAEQHYGDRTPEFMSCSKGIGERWARKYAADTLRDDFIVMRGHEMPVPRYYRKKLDLVDPERMRELELERISQANTKRAKRNATPERLAVRHEVTRAGLAALKARKL